jgi:succinoglycan biosynthesis transport protein ExoP
MEPQFSTDLSDYIAALKRRRALLAYVAVPIAALGIALALGLPDRYLSKSLIEFSQAEISGEVPGSARAQSKNYYDQYVASLSDAVLNSENMVERLKRPDAPKPRADESQPELMERIADNADIQTVRVPVLDPDSGRDREIISAFTVGFQSGDPKEAHQIATWLTQAFLEESRNSLKSRALSSAQFYTGEAERYRAQITGLESKLADFKLKNQGQLPELTDMNMNVMDRVERDLAGIDLQLGQLRQNRVFLAQQLETARNSGQDQNLLGELEAEYAKKQAIYDPDHPDLINLRRQIESLRRGGPAMEDMSLNEQLTAQQAILSQTRQRYSEDHPDVKRIERQIEALKARIARGDKQDNTVRASPTVVQIQTQINAADTEMASLTARAGDLRTKLEQIEKRVEATPQVEREYQTLTRDLTLARTKYDDLLKSQMDAELTAAAIAGGRSDELRLVTLPVTPAAPAKPRRLAIGLIGIILATIAGLATVVFSEGMDQTVRGSRDVRRVLSVAPLAVIPEILDASTIRARRFRVVLVAGCTLIGSVIVVMTMRSLS